MSEFGELLGWAIIVLYGLTVLNYIVKYINKKFIKQLNRNKDIKNLYSFFMKNIIKYHKLVGLFTVLFILLHFFVQFKEYGVNITGLVAALAMIGQVILGAYGAYVNKKRKGLWFILHRIISVILFVTILIHIL